MKTLVNRPGVVLLIAGIVSFFLRWPASWIPWLGGMLAWMLWLLAIFFVIGGLWMIFIGRPSKD